MIYIVPTFNINQYTIQYTIQYNQYINRYQLFLLIILIGASY